eukprot:TRINITY_DN9010_c0_g1_i1.p1 TRINITY_DN9010_c0_g1~~TRINITY_DN9010_c0_g1_i1.p1  ORF type:complete len:113 (-),score=21.12 TRINITY_DN9010_c0_g1_i1:100-438(-)
MDECIHDRWFCDENVDCSDGSDEVDCPTSLQNRAAGVSELCGNGEVERPERCDDGNTSPYDTCANDCTWTFCGDGYIQEVLDEECDNGPFDDEIGECKYCRIACGDGDRRSI